MLKHVVGVALVAGLSLAGTAWAQTAASPPSASTAAPQPNDYSNGQSWLCRPGRPGKDACDVDLTTTVVAADGKLTREKWTAAPGAPIDCFYVYPTVSTDPTPNSDMTADPAELNVIRQQFARFGSACRPYAPLYRQVTLAGLRTRLAAGSAGASLAQGLQYDDVREAWNHYIEHDNKGRGFVLVGHSQGSFILAELIRKEIDGKPVQSRMVSALLLGATLAVPRGKDVGGAFQHVPLCRSASQTGCVITYASFRSTVPPPANTLFGKVGDPNMVAACTNPAALGGGSGELHAYLSTDGRTITGTTRAQAVGGSRAADRDAVGERARAADGAMRVQRQRHVSGSHGARRSVRSARRRYRRRHRRERSGAGELGPASHRCQPRDGQSG